MSASIRKRIFRPAIEGTYEEPWYRLPRMSASWVLELLEHRRQELSSGLEGYALERFQRGFETLTRAATYIVREIEKGHGRRFQMSSRTLGAALGMSQSTGSRCLRRLREMGILVRYREHRIKRQHHRWWGKASIHEVVTHPYGEDHLSLESHSLTCENPGRDLQ